ncbi:MAG: hypothetical protein HYW57_02580, partial [Ignavibacteriales bacterium]|nr:hypothetical protein [Ignavibacteriales bacterium]
SHWLPLTGIDGIQPPPRIELRPYVAFTRKFLQSPQVASFNQGRNDPFAFGRDYLGGAGADAKIGLSGDFTLDVSVNPDFAQVEVDPAVVNLTAYETFFAEKRPFFIEGSNILAFGRGGAASYIDLNWSDPSFFYSRRIGRAPQGNTTHDGFKDIPDRTTILGAAKVSGKTQDGWSLAGLTALTDREYGRIDSAGTRFTEEIEPLTFYGVVRAQKQFMDSRHAVGAVATFVERGIRTAQLEDLLSRRAVSFGLDGWSFLDEEKEWVVTGWTGLTHVVGSESQLRDLQESPRHYFQKPDAHHVDVDSGTTTLTGWAGRIWMAKDKGNWRFNAAAGFISPGFESNDLGFHPFADIVNMHIYTGYWWYEPDPLFRTKSVWTAYLREHNFGGIKTGETYHLGTEAQLLNYWGGWFLAGYNTEFFDDRRTRGGPLMKSLPSYFGYLGIYSDSREDVNGSFSLLGDRGKSGGWDYTLTVTMNWRVTTTLNLSLGPSYERHYVTAQFVDVVEDAAAIETFGKRYLFATLHQRTASANVRANWTFTPALSFQVYLQPYLTAGEYTGFKQLARPSTFSFIPASPASDPTFNFKSLRINTVLRWEYLPGSTLYVVWTNEKVNLESQYGMFRLGRDFSQILRATPNNVFSLKLTYWWSP